MWAKLKSWLLTSERDTCGPTLLLWSVGPLWRGWAASSTLGVNISEDLTWTTHIQTQVKKARQRLCHQYSTEIQGLTNNPENFLFRDHIKCIDSVYFSVVWKQLQSRLQSLAESCALSWAHLRVCSPLSAGHLPQTLQKQSCQNHQGLEPP